VAPAPALALNVRGDIRLSESSSVTVPDTWLLFAIDKLADSIKILKPKIFI
jgi:hypothetical protein